MDANNRHLVWSTESVVRQRMIGQQAGHGYDHVMRVLKTAREIQSELGGDLLVVELAAVLHDVGDAKFHQGVERSGQFTREILTALSAEASTIDHVVHIVENLSFRKTADAEALSLEGQIVQDADRLDALGAIGIVRTIEYGSAAGQPFYADPSEGKKTGVGHFHEKLFKLKGLLNTDVARRMAEGREEFMRTFLEQFHRECGHTDGR